MATQTMDQFQLPALPFSHESLTAGTDIPPPPPSPPPRKSSLPSPIPQAPNPLQLHPSTSSFALPLSTTTSNMPGAFPSSPLSPLSPASPGSRSQMDYIGFKSRTVSNTLPRDAMSSSKRPNGIRKFLSLRSLNGSWNNSNANGNGNADTISQRPESPSGFSVAGSMRPSLNRKRSSLFWGRRKTSLDPSYEVENQAPVREGTPPPMLPEVQKLTGGEGHGEGGFLGGADMFRNIR